MSERIWRDNDRLSGSTGSVFGRVRLSRPERQTMFAQLSDRAERMAICSAQRPVCSPAVADFVCAVNRGGGYRTGAGFWGLINKVLIREGIVVFLFTCFE